MATEDRPLSPHLTVYRWQITMILSIFHRGTGVMLVVGTLLLVYWLIAAAMGPGPYEAARSFFGFWLVQLALFVWTWCLIYHLLNGVRHLVWDMGYGYEIRNLTLSGWFVYLAAAGLTVLAWIAGYHFKGVF